MLCELCSVNVSYATLDLQLWCSYDDLTGGVNVLVVKLNDNGGMFSKMIFLYYAILFHE